MMPTYDTEINEWVYPPPEKFDCAKPLLLTSGEQTSDTCQNIQSDTKPIEIPQIIYKEENGAYTNFAHYKDKHPDVTLLDMLQQICSVAQVKACRNEICCSIKQKMEDTPAPACEWKHFRDWALVVVSCQLNASQKGLEVETWNLASIIHTLSMEVYYPGHEKPKASVILFDLCELINWLNTINSFILPEFEFKQPLRTHISRQEIVEATQTAHKNGICMNRLWNLAVGGHEREEVDLPVLMRMLQSQNRTDSSDVETSHRSSGHDTCTAEVCCFSSIDSTRVQQLHKCSDKACDDILWFRTSGVQSECITWWLDDGEKSPYIVDSKKEPYMAISHVWSDGTGGGVQGDGHVNRCLFNYFRDIAISLGCRAIWWDTISIPSERVARQKAISRMHENFREASHTIIHDQSIVQSPWTDGGRSCLALVLSPWFTRAWTALELRLTHKGKVWVIYDDPSGYKLKNLDENILARHPAYSSRGHWIVSSLVEQLRQQQFNNIGDILKVLRTRNTSWPRDLMVVAGLLTEHKPETTKSDFIALITRAVIAGLVVIEESFLYHGHATMSQKGGWSWCPFSLLDVQLRTNADEYERIYVDEQGATTGYWKYRELEKGDTDKLQPYSFHISVHWQIRTALDQWENCLLLQHRYTSPKALLVIPLGSGISNIGGEDYHVLECQFVGTVYTLLEWGESFRITVRLGKLESEPIMNAKDCIDEYRGIKGPRMVMPPSGHDLISIREARKKLLAPSERA